MPVCPRCGKIVGDLRKHQKRRRCDEQRKHVGFLERKVRKFERRVMS